VKIILYQLDGKLPNIALMRISAHHRSRGDEVELRWQPHGRRELWDSGTELVYASLIFEKTRRNAEDMLRYWPEAIVGGTGWRVESSLEEAGIHEKTLDYSLYPGFRQSIGFTQRGCRLKCKFCVVPRKEPKLIAEQTVRGLWRGDPYPRELILLDNDFFGQDNWRALIEEIRAGAFKVNFCQGINARFLTDEAAEAISSVDYRDATMKNRRLHTAWDNRKDEDRLFAGLNRLVDHGVKPDHIMVYVLIGFWPGETDEGWEYRRMRLREFGARPYPMPYVRTPETVGFQRFVVGAYDKRIAWSDFKAAGFNPRKLGMDATLDQRN
jgi:hypothetical protein